ncbi:Lysozyme c-1 [Gryllus bimaculatus]|nr:Lysozyme c-1 [Gryllus bimaculatus]
MARSLLALCLVALVVSESALPAVAVVLSKCTVAKALYDNGIAKSQIPDWLCLIEHESSFNTAAINVNTNGSKDNGIFQINDTWWCGETAVGALLNTDITDDIRCAKLIYSRQGFNAWYGWKNHCQGVTLPSISDCEL